jgi:integrase
MRRQPTKRLKKLVEEYIADRNEERPVNAPLAKASCAFLRECVATFARYLCRPPTVADLTAEHVNGMLRYLLKNGRSAYTVKSRRTGMRALWKYAHSRGLAGPFERVQNVRLPALNVQGYDDQAMTALIEHVATMRGVLRSTGLPKRMWWETFLAVLWETGIRSGDMLLIEPKHFDKKGWLWIEEQKTGKRAWLHIRPSVAERLVEFINFDYSRERIWPGYTRRNLSRAFAEMVDAVGVGGTLRWIRRGAASDVERLHPGAAWRFLRHSVPTLFDKHYRVDKIVEQNPVTPTEIKTNVFRPIAEKENKSF